MDFISFILGFPGPFKDPLYFLFHAMSAPSQASCHFQLEVPSILNSSFQSAISLSNIHTCVYTHLPCSSPEDTGVIYFIQVPAVQQVSGFQGPPFSLKPSCSNPAPAPAPGRKGSLSWLHRVQPRAPSQSVSRAARIPLHSACITQHSQPGWTA